MSRSVPRNIDRKGEHLSRCDVCSVPYLRSALRRGRDGLLRCENDQPGRDELTLAELTANRAAALIAGAAFRVIPGAGHLPPVEAPSEWAALLRPFLHQPLNSHPGTLIP